MQGSNPSSALFSAQRPDSKPGWHAPHWQRGHLKQLMDPSLQYPAQPDLRSDQWSTGVIQQRPMIPELDAPPNAAETDAAIKQLQTGKARDQMEYQPRCSKPVVKLLSLTLPGCSKCSGSMVSSHGTSGMPTSSTCTKTRVIAHPATTTAGSASSALQARY